MTCRARDMVYGRCQLKRRHEGRHAIELVEGVQRFVWDANSAIVEHKVKNSLDSFTLTIDRTECKHE